MKFYKRTPTSHKLLYFYCIIIWIPKTLPSFFLNIFEKWLSIYCGVISSYSLNRNNKLFQNTALLLITSKTNYKFYVSLTSSTGLLSYYYKVRYGHVYYLGKLSFLWGLINSCQGNMFLNCALECFSECVNIHYMEAPNWLRTFKYNWTNFVYIIKFKGQINDIVFL